MPGPIVFEVDVQIALSLASIGYLGEGALNSEKFTLMSAALKQPDLPMHGRWQIVWGPAEGETSLWYMAAGPDAQGHPALAIVIRGTQMNLPASLKLDRELDLEPVPWADPGAPPGVLISQGFKQEMINLLLAVDPRSGLTAVQFLRKLLGTAGPTPNIKVIGHSLGGATAPIASLWVKHEFPELEIRPFPFGGQSPGNQAFADWYTGAFARWPSRYVNDLDATPMMFAELEAMKKLWGRPSIPMWLRLLLDGVERIMKERQIRYVPTPRARVFEGHLYDVSGLGSWEAEASAQHEHLYYMYLSGIPLDVIRNGLGPSWSPPPELGNAPHAGGSS